MILVIGESVLVLSAFLYGIERSNCEKSSFELSEALCEFVKHIGQQIEMFRTPLFKIYEEYSDDCLEKACFLETLCMADLNEALLLLKDKIPKEVFYEMDRFSHLIGAGYEKGQGDLCRYTVQRLENIIEEKRVKLTSRIRMYRLLPVLLALSVLILLI